MKKIVPFKKDIIFKTNLKEIISIALDHELSKEDNFIKGKFVVAGEYKMLETSINTEKFSYDLPFTVELNESYILDNVVIDIDDFYYEIINDNILSVHIDVLIDNIEEKEIIKEEIEPILEEKEWVREELPIVEGRCVEKEDTPPKKEVQFIESDLKETYKSYTVYIMRENDTIESVIQKYGINKEILDLYNDLNNIKIGDKIIIPSV
jgi:ribosomal protein S17